MRDTFEVPVQSTHSTYRQHTHHTNIMSPCKDCFRQQCTCSKPVPLTVPAKMHIAPTPRHGVCTLRQTKHRILQYARYENSKPRPTNDSIANKKFVHVVETSKSEARKPPYMKHPLKHTGANVPQHPAHKQPKTVHIRLHVEHVCSRAMHLQPMPAAAPELAVAANQPVKQKVKLDTKASLKQGVAANPSCTHHKPAKSLRTDGTLPARVTTRARAKPLCTAACLLFFRARALSHHEPTAHMHPQRSTHQLP